MPHACDSLVPSLAAQSLPPFDAAVDTAYDRDTVPPSHVAEHEPQLPQDPAQSTGHAPVPHACDSLLPSLTAQSLPPLAAVVETEYVLDSVPPPHVAEHEPQLPQEPTQSTGQTPVLQFCDSLVPSPTAQAVPPFEAAVDTE